MADPITINVFVDVSRSRMQERARELGFSPGTELHEAFTRSCHGLRLTLLVASASGTVEVIALNGVALTAPVKA